ncbi:hypothetical protein ACNO5E_14130 [Vibrio parahaemolyticus]
MQNLPEHVQRDLNAGYQMTDIDDGFQRCLEVSSTVFEYKCERNGETFEMRVDVSEIDKDEAVSGFYTDEQEVIAEYGSESNMIIAECYFENNIN